MGATGASVVVFTTSPPYPRCGYQPHRPPTPVFLTPSWVSTLPLWPFFRPLPLMGFSRFASVPPHGGAVLSGTNASVSGKRWYIATAACGSLPRLDYGAHSSPGMVAHTPLSLFPGLQLTIYPSPVRYRLAFPEASAVLCDFVRCLPLDSQRTIVVSWTL